MNLNQVTLPSLNLDVAIPFYQTLGLTLIVDARPDYARFVCPDGEATCSLQRVAQLPDGHGIHVYFECRELDQTVAALRNRGIPFHELPNDKPWLWREAHLKDPDGNHLILYHAGHNRLNPPWRLPTATTSTTDNLHITAIEDPAEWPYHLLLSADPSRKNIDAYLAESDVYVGQLHGVTVGCYVLCPVGNQTVEIKNMAVTAPLQGRGIGTALLHHAIGQARANGFRQIIIGTGNSSIGQLYLYQKVGFSMSHIKPDYFTLNYSEPIVENGIACRHMVVLAMDL
jgi:GNAT superfamily N-acetyltransferase/predicted enzyme related to lactoylglutathione lyase